MATFEIKKYTINNGGSVLESAQFRLSGSTAQVDAAPQSIGGTFTLSSGFWQKQHAQTIIDPIFKNGFE